MCSRNSISLSFLCTKIWINVSGSARRISREAPGGETTKFSFLKLYQEQWTLKQPPASLACLWHAETERKLLVKRIVICRQYLLFWAIIRLCCKEFWQPLYISYLYRPFPPPPPPPFLCTLWSLPAVSSSSTKGPRKIFENMWKTSL